MPDATVVTLVAVASFLEYAALAFVVRARSLRARGPSVRTRQGLAASRLPYFVWLPYVVLAARPGPELEVTEPLAWLGLALVVGGTTFASWSAITLGRHFDMEVEVHRGHEVVRTGPYAIVRHPVYAGLAVHFLGMCLASGNLVLVAGVLGAAIPAFVLRAREEESLLREELGDAYDRYAREVPMLVPFVR
ncbi:MAG TPA: isoprenylcysteine carboxylmethyltransferase family protein [Candidatus Limnocylindria bacterium]|nr:isoprenylcysteine carboxylmethyltransferase family protein [Candidatus Limnocylindria bacterium]